MSTYSALAEQRSYRTVSAFVIAAYLLFIVIPIFAAGPVSRARTVGRAVDAAQAAHRLNRAVHAGKAAVPWAKIAKVSGTLPDREIVRLSRLANLHGSPRVGQEIQHLRLSDSLREDTYLRIAIHQRLRGFSRAEALEMQRHLTNIDGFAATLRKAISNREQQRIGHLNELVIATTAARRGFRVLALGRKFNDGRKKALTDLDILLSKGVKLFALEVKDHARPLSLSTYRADLDSLVQYKRLHNSKAIPVFTLINKPDNPALLRTMQREADRRNIELIFGSPDGQIHKLGIIAKIS